MSAPLVDDPREHIEISVMMTNGKLAPRTFATREEAEAWAQEGEEVVEFSPLCDCEM